MKNNDILYTISIYLLISIEYFDNIVNISRMKSSYVTNNKFVKNVGD